jgi:iduronate 2-sulfatase
MNKALYLLLIVVSSTFLGCADKPTNEKPNIVFIAVDDLRPEINMYGKSLIISPKLDKLAEDGLVFKRAYCNVPVCGASRASLMTGIFPTPQRFTTYGSRVDEEANEYPTLTETLKNNGYLTTSVGKIFHHPDDGLDGWSQQPYRPDYPNSIHQQELWRDYQSEELNWTNESDLPLGAAGPAWEVANVADTVYYDGKTTQLALNKLEELKGSDKPFFFGLG